MMRLVALVTCMLLTACVGSRHDIRFATAQVPISLSSQLLDAQGRKLTSEDLEVVGHVGAGHRGWSLFWSLLPLKGIDFSADVNAQVAAVGGEGVINLVLTSQDGCTRSLNQVPFAAFLPIFPGCADVTISGDIVRQRRDLPKKGLLRLLR